MIPITGLISALMIFPAPTPAHSALAMVADLSGKMSWEGGKGIRLLDEIAQNRTALLEKDARLVLVMLSDGEERVFRGPCRVRFNAAGKAEGARPVEVKRHPGSDALRLRPGGMAQAAAVMRSGSQKVALDVCPRGPVILEATPAFQWEALGTRATYHFKLFDSRGRLHLEEILTGTTFQIPDDKPLRRGETYTWILEARIPDQAPRVFTGDVNVLDGARREELEKTKPGPDATFSERLVHAALLEELQIADEARKCWQRLAQERPGDTRLKALAAR